MSSVSYETHFVEPTPPSLGGCSSPDSSTRTRSLLSARPTDHPVTAARPLFVNGPLGSGRRSTSAGTPTGTRRRPARRTIVVFRRCAACECPGENWRVNFGSRASDTLLRRSPVRVPRVRVEGRRHPPTPHARRQQRGGIRRRQGRGADRRHVRDPQGSSTTPDPWTSSRPQASTRATRSSGSRSTTKTHNPSGSRPCRARARPQPSKAVATVVESFHVANSRKASEPPTTVSGRLRLSPGRCRDVPLARRSVEKRLEVRDEARP